MEKSPPPPHSASQMTGARAQTPHSSLFYAAGPPVDEALPVVTVGVRFHDSSRLALLERCLCGIGAQVGVHVHVHLALQDFTPTAEQQIRRSSLAALDGSGFSLIIENVPNPDKADLRSRLLNRIVDAHYDRGQSDYLCFIDFDDMWFGHALETLVHPLRSANYAMSYADIHCADVYTDSGQIYLRGIKDVYQISQKTKRDLLRGNFLPLHSYMFHTGRIDRSVLSYDETLERLEDFDVLLAVAGSYPVSGLYRNRLIGLYNFYETTQGDLNSTPSVFSSLPADPALKSIWKRSNAAIIARHAGTKWQEYFGEEWLI